MPNLIRHSFRIYPMELADSKPMSCANKMSLLFGRDLNLFTSYRIERQGHKKGRDESRPLEFFCDVGLILGALALFQFFDQLRHDLEEIPDHAEVGVLKDRRF